MGQNKRFYDAKAREWGLGEAGSGTPQVAVFFEILTPDATHQGLTWYGSLTDNAFERTIESLRHCGWKGTDLEEIAAGKGDLNANVVSLTVEDEEYPAGSGQWRTKVQWVNRRGGLAIKAPLAGDKLRAFSAQMKGKIAALDAAKGTRPAAASKPANGGPPTGQPEPPPITDDQLPF